MFGCQERSTYIRSKLAGRGGRVGNGRGGWVRVNRESGSSNLTLTDTFP
jgi:hypothetical protein